jgi:putative toxin-antitoxin system antitoxin component (TIGR02293 family)
MASLLECTRLVLGLTKKQAPNELKLADLVSRGLPAESVTRLIEQGIPDRDIFRTVIPRRTFQRRLASQAPLSPTESDRVERFARILALASLVLDGERRAVQWLSTKKRRFNDARPLDLLESNTGTKLVEDTLLQAYYGNVG